MLSPTTVLQRQKGNCFEYSTLLCSLLIASGYDAYVVNGYATRETCLADETREICPLLKKKEEVSCFSVLPEYVSMICTLMVFRSDCVKVYTFEL